MSPFRSVHPTEVREESAPIGEEGIIYGVLAGVGAIPVAGALADHAAFHTEATIGLFMVVAGVLGLVSCARAAWLARGARRDDVSRRDCAPD